MKFRTILAIVASSLGLAPQATAAFPERDIEFVIPYNPGGGNDTIVRMIAPYIEKHLPGNVSVVPVNTPGAGGQRGATTVYRADPDGYTIGLFPMPGLALPGVLGETVEFDLEEMTWLGRLEASHYVLLVPATSDIQSLDDLGDGRDVTILSTGFGSTMLAASQIMAGALGIDATYVTGYQSSSDAMAGLIRGDGNAAMGVIEPSASYVESGDLRPLAVSVSRPALPDVPTFEELGHPELNVLSLDRWVGAPPNLDPEARSVLEKALMDALSDPDFQAQAEAAGIVLAPLSGDEVSDLVSESMSFFDRYKANLQNPANQ